jgi:hypothetical protein
MEGIICNTVSHGPPVARFLLTEQAIVAERLSEHGTWIPTGTIPRPAGPVAGYIEFLRDGLTRLPRPIRTVGALVESEIPRAGMPPARAFLRCDRNEIYRVDTLDSSDDYALFDAAIAQYLVLVEAAIEASRSGRGGQEK